MPLAWGHLWAHAKIWLLMRARVIVLPATSAIDSWLLCHSILLMETATLCHFTFLCGIKRNILICRDNGYGTYHVLYSAQSA